MQSLTPEIDRAILDLIDSFRTIGAELASDQDPPLLTTHRALITAIAAALDAARAEERERWFGAIRAYVRPKYLAESVIADELKKDN